MLPKIVITDIDGVWTDGGMFYDQTGNEWKKFNTYDSAGVLWCRFNNIPVVIMTGEDTEIVRRRAEKLKIEHLHMGVQNKVQELGKLLGDLGISWKEAAYLGDDINDYHVMEMVGYSACPQSAPSYIKEIVDEVIPIDGGQGVFRAFVEQILERNDLMRSTLDAYLAQRKKTYNQ